MSTFQHVVLQLLLAAAAAGGAASCFEGDPHRAVSCKSGQAVLIWGLCGRQPIPHGP